MPISTVCGAGRACRARLRGRRRARRRAARMAGPRRRLSARRPARHRRCMLSPQHGPTFRNARVTGYGAMAARVERIAAIRRFLDANGFATADAPAYSGRRLDALLRTAHARRQTACILMNSPRAAGRAAGARRQALQRHRPSGRKRDAVRRHGAGFARTRLFGAGDHRRRPRGRPFAARGSWRRAGRRRRSPAPIEARYDVAVDALVALHGMRCRRRSASSRASITACRLTTWRRC